MLNCWNCHLSDSPANCIEWLVSNIKKLPLIKVYLKGMNECTIFTIRFVPIDGDDFVTKSLLYLIDESKFPRPPCISNTFGLFDAWAYEPVSLALETLGKKWQSKLN